MSNRPLVFVLTMLYTLLIGNIESAQAQRPSADTAYLSREALNRLLYQKLGSIVTGQSSSTSIGNYASLDPANGSFIFKGSFGLDRKNDSAQISYFTFRLEGSLISDSYAALFTNSKLNTGGVVEAQYHFRLGRAGITYFESDKARVHRDTLMAYLDYMAQIDQLFKADAERQNLIDDNRFQLSQAQYDLDLLQKKRDSINLERKKALNDRNMPALKQLNTLADSIGAVMAKCQTKLVILNKEKDSLAYAASAHNAFSLRNAQKHIINEAYRHKKMQMESAAPYNQMRLRWLTIIGGVSRKNFYTFDSNKPFESQFTKQVLDGYRVGLTYNYYRETNETKRARFFNAGFVRYKDNNTALLNTMQINQEIVFKNNGGDTTRKVSRPYHVYTDPIVESEVWSLFANWYFINKGRSQSFHLYPSADIYEEGNTVWNLGLGYVICFRNNKKDQPLINAEGYIQFQDLFNQLDGKAGFWNRNEMGVRFTLPFNFF